MLGELLRKFPVPQIAPDQNKPEEAPSNKADTNKNDTTKVTIKQEPVDEVVSNSTTAVPNVQIKQEPPEKKMKMG